MFAERECRGSPEARPQLKCRPLCSISRIARKGNAVTAPFAADLASAGFEVVDAGLPAEQLEALRAAVGPVLAAHPGRGGLRNAANLVPELIPVISGPLKSLARSRLGPNASGVRVLLFDKTAMTNWKATWHQDVTIAVTEQRAVAGLGALVQQGRGLARTTAGFGARRDADTASAP